MRWARVSPGESTAVWWNALALSRPAKERRVIRELTGVNRAMRMALVQYHCPGPGRRSPGGSSRSVRCGGVGWGRPGRLYDLHRMRRPWHPGIVVEPQEISHAAYSCRGAVCHTIPFFAHVDGNYPASSAYSSRTLSTRCARCFSSASFFRLSYERYVHIPANGPRSSSEKTGRVNS